MGRRILMLIGALPMLLLGPVTLQMAPAAEPLRLATWNLEWLLTPQTAQAGRLACRAGRRTALPCDVALEQSRDSADLARLARHARRVAADVFAFQEVESAAIAQRVFVGYDICIAPGKGLQHVGFAVRRNLPHRCGQPVQSLSLAGTQRPGLMLILQPDSPAAIELLAVHLKSGCADADLATHSSACSILARQAKVLHQWLTAQVAQQSRFIVLGDFNRSNRDLEHDAFWQALRGDGDAAPYVHADTGVPYRNCFVGAPFSRAIDHLLIAHTLEKAIVAGSYRRYGYGSLEAIRYHLSDHCPVSISLIPSLDTPEEAKTYLH